MGKKQNAGLFSFYQKAVSQATFRTETKEKTNPNRNKPTEKKTRKDIAIYQAELCSKKNKLATEIVLITC